MWRQDESCFMSLIVSSTSASKNYFSGSSSLNQRKEPELRVCGFCPLVCQAVTDMFSALSTLYWCNGMLRCVSQEPTPGLSLFLLGDPFFSGLSLHSHTPPSNIWTFGTSWHFKCQRAGLRERLCFESICCGIRVAGTAVVEMEAHRKHARKFILSFVLPLFPNGRKKKVNYFTGQCKFWSTPALLAERLIELPVGERLSCVCHHRSPLLSEHPRSCEKHNLQKMQGFLTTLGFKELHEFKL